MHCLQQALKDTGEDNMVTMKALAENFNSDAWRDLGNSQSELCRYLLRAAPNINHSLNYQKMVMLGMLYCRDAKKPIAKAKAFFNLLQEGGVER